VLAWERTLFCVRANAFLYLNHETAKGGGNIF